MGSEKRTQGFRPHPLIEEADSCYANSFAHGGGDIVKQESSCVIAY